MPMRCVIRRYVLPPEEAAAVDRMKLLGEDELSKSEIVALAIRITAELFEDERSLFSIFENVTKGQN